jgi:hypothetical protein
MALEWLKQEVRALWPQGQRWVASMRYELSRVQALHRRERARERLLQAERDNARVALERWQARRDLASGMSRAELAERAQAEVQRHAAEMEAIQVVLEKQQQLTSTLTEKLSAMEARFLAASERAAQPRRPELLIDRTLDELTVREQRFARCEQQLQQHWPSLPVVARDPQFDDLPAQTVASTASPAAELTPAPTALASTELTTTEPAATDADFITTDASTDKSERAP